MRQVFDSVTDVSLWLASQGFFVTLLLVLIPYAIISFPVQYLDPAPTPEARVRKQ